MIEIKSTIKQKLAIGEYLYGESAIYLEGAVESDGNVYETKQMLVTKDSTLCEFTMLENSTVYIFGGEPFPEERFIDWNFVASSKALIEEAKQKWKAQTFDKVKGDETEFIPYPKFPKKNEKLIGKPL